MYKKLYLKKKYLEINHTTTVNTYNDLCKYIGFICSTNFNSIEKIIKKYNIIIKKKTLFVGPHILSDDDESYIKNFDGIIILYITEPIYNFYPKTYELYINNTFDFIFGSINNTLYTVKYPYYVDLSNISYHKKDQTINTILYHSPLITLDDANLFYKINNLIQKMSSEEILNKKFCCIINSHDNGNTRTAIYNILKNINNINAPGRLFNNESSNELNTMGNVKYIHQFKFIICSENFITPLKGYVTEKIMSACLACAIPIYSGDLDKIDKQIFNINRIIIYDSQNLNSIFETAIYVNNLMNNTELFIQHYKMPIFMENAHKIINNMEYNVASYIKNILQ